VFWHVYSVADRTLRNLPTPTVLLCCCRHTCAVVSMRSQAWKLCSGAARCLQLAAAGLQQQSPQTLAALHQLHTTTAAAAAAAAAAGGPGPGKLSAKRLGLADVQHVIAVASGKGGVGKSTVAGWARHLLLFHSQVAQMLTLHWSAVDSRMPSRLLLQHAHLASHYAVQCFRNSAASWLQEVCKQPHMA
jgi:hypothetical protein